MSVKKVVAVLLIAIIVLGVLYFTLNPISVLVIEVGYTALPILVDNELKDVEFTFRVDRFLSSMPPYELAGGPQLVVGESKLSIFGIELNLTLHIDVYNNSTNGTLWRSADFVFSSIAERKVQFFSRTPANTSLGERAVIVVDGRLMVWREGESPYIDKTFARTFTGDIPR